jgi:pimeloyl-ACP methyl ester carboxylesterase
MPEFDTGEVQANGLRFHYLEMGKGPLALCLHGFPDSPYSYRYLLPELAEAGYRAVSQLNRGFAPTELPAERHHVHSSISWRCVGTTRSELRRIRQSVNPASQNASANYEKKHTRRIP